MATKRSIPIRQSIHLRSTLESKGSQIKQIEWDTYFNCKAKDFQRFQDSKIASLEDSLQNANKKLKPQGVPKTNNSIRLTVTPSTAPIFFFLSTHSTNPLSELPFHSQETTRL